MRYTDKWLWILLLIILVVLLLGGKVLYGAPSKLYKVLRVPDGDTIVIAKPCHKTELCEETIRLIGIDTPEMPFFGKPRECYAEEAKLMTKQIVFDENPDGVSLERHGQDRFGRTLAYVFVPLTAADPTGPVARLRTNSVNYFLVKNGYAKAELRFKHKYLEDYKKAEEWAHSNKQGMWFVCIRGFWGGRW